MQRRRLPNTWSARRRLDRDAHRAGADRQAEDCTPGGYRRAVLRAARCNPEMSVAQLATLCGCSQSTVRKHLDTSRGAAARQRPLAAQVRAARPVDRAHLAGEPGLPGTVLARLARDQNPGVRLSLAMNSEAPVQVIARLATDPEPAVRAEAIWHASCPDRLIRTAAGHAHDKVRAAAVRWQGWGPDTVAAAANDAAPLVRMAAAVRGDCPTAVLATLAGDAVTEVRRCVGSNPNTPTQTLQRLAHDSDLTVLFAVARNASTPSEALHYLLGSLHNLRNLRNHTLIPRSRRDAVGEAAAANPNLAPQELRDASRNRHDLYLRKGAARNPALRRRDRIRLMWLDRDWRVRDAARQASRTRRSARRSS